MTDPGRAREANEDTLLIEPLTLGRRADEQGHLFMVADGMGGVHGGARASALAVSTIKGLVFDALRGLHAQREPGEGQVEDALQAALRRADARLFEEGARDPEVKGMGTTLTMAYSFGGELFVAHVGDSRCYLLRRGVLHQLTRDHTVVQEMVRHGLLPPERAADHALRHMITNVVGGTLPGVEVELHKVASAPGDVLLLCSDGLTEMLSDAGIAAILSAEAEPSAACARLVTRANELGGYDNVTAIVARYDLAG